jgi:DNA-binding winged helix-turn-helix (wHTH) protein
VSEQNHYIYEFGPFRLDAQKRLLLREGEIVSLKPKAFDTLLTLVEGCDRVVEKDELMRRVWPGTAVEEGNLTFNISSLRKALGDDPRRHEYIVMIPGEGYRFVAGVRATFDELVVHESTSITVEEEEEISGASIADRGLPIENFPKLDAPSEGGKLVARNPKSEIENGERWPPWPCSPPCREPPSASTGSSANAGRGKGRRRLCPSARWKSRGSPPPAKSRTRPSRPTASTSLR